MIIEQKRMQWVITLIDHSEQVVNPEWIKRITRGSNLGQPTIEVLIERLDGPIWFSCLEIKPQ